MSLLRRAKRRDANEPEIVKALQAVGAYVQRFDQPVDLLVGFRSRWVWLEVKDGAKTAGNRPLTEDQIEFLRDCQGYGLPACVVTSVSEALSAIGAVR